jgi:hypothetical protein
VKVVPLKLEELSYSMENGPMEKWHLRDHLVFLGYVASVGFTDNLT